MAVTNAGNNLTPSYGALLGRLHRSLEGDASSPDSTTGTTYAQDTYVRSGGGGSYMVKSGDTLSAIAKRTLGSASRWREIYELNKSVIGGNPNLIKPGQVLTLPGGASAQNSASADSARSTSDNAPPEKVYTLLDKFHNVVERFRAARLGHITADQLKVLGQTNKDAFFNALRPAAEEAQQKYGVPAAVTLAQAALESGWGKSALGGYNIFGIKGSGPAGSVEAATQEYYGGRYVSTQARFAKYDSLDQAIVEHAKVFHHGYYDKAIAQYQQDHDPKEFARNINGIYATDPNYARSLISIMDTYNLA